MAAATQPSRRRASDSAVADAVRAGLGARRKRLPAWLLYDDAGSDLFEAITRLPEYYLTRTERRILRAHAGDMIDAAGVPASVVELGAGSAKKTRVLLAALLERRDAVAYFPVDVSPRALGEAERQLRGALPRLAVHPVPARYPDEMAFVRQAPRSRMVLFLGSNIGNYEPSEAVALLAEVRRGLDPGDVLLLGADLRKAPALVLPAYDDAAGVTSAFSKNVLARINRELGGRFDVDAFRHVAEWSEEASRIEIHLESAADQVVAIDGLGLVVRFAAGERIHTENSYKFTLPALSRILGAAGFVVDTHWTDARGWFTVLMARC